MICTRLNKKATKCAGLKIDGISKSGYEKVDSCFSYLFIATRV
jgi:hypothetical protein